MEEISNKMKTVRREHALAFMREILSLCQKYEYSIGGQYDAPFVYEGNIDGWPDGWQKNLVLEYFDVTPKRVAASYRDDSNKIRDDEIEISGV